MPAPDVVIKDEAFAKITEVKDGERVLSAKVVACLTAKGIVQEEEYFIVNGVESVEYFMFTGDKLEMYGSNAKMIETVMMDCVNPPAPKKTSSVDRLRAKIEARRAEAAKGGRGGKSRKVRKAGKRLTRLTRRKI